MVSITHAISAIVKLAKYLTISLLFYQLPKPMQQDHFCLVSQVFSLDFLCCMTHSNFKQCKMNVNQYTCKMVFRHEVRTRI